VTPEYNGDNLDWDTIARTVLEALRRRAGNRPGLLEAERFADSAIRTALRRMQEGALEPMPPEQLVCSLIKAAHRKYIDAVRHSEVERRHQGAVADRQAKETRGRLEREAAEAAAREEVSELFARATPEERIVLEGRLAEWTQVQIADAIAKLPERKGKCSQATVSNIWQRLCQRLKTRAEGTEVVP
jgi:hypothetical protein